MDVPVGCQSPTENRAERLRQAERGGRTGVTGVAVLVIGTALSLGGCVSDSATQQFGITTSPSLIQAVPSDAGSIKIGSPYKIAGRVYRPHENPGYDEVGLASWYGSDFHGRRTASGERFDMAELSAAHPTLPLPTYARVTNLENGRSVVVRINDRGPFAHNRLIDLSKRTADLLDFHGAGTARVRVQYVGMEPPEGYDGQWLTTTVRQDGEPVGPVVTASIGGTSEAAGSAVSQGAVAYGPPAAAPAAAPASNTAVAFSLAPGYLPAAGPSVAAQVFAAFEDADGAVLLIALTAAPQ